MEIVFYNRWMVEFISQQHHNTIFAFLQVSSYTLVALGILNLVCKINLRNNISWAKIALFLAVAVVLFTASLYVITRIVMFKPEVERGCESFVAEIDRI